MSEKPLQTLISRFPAGHRMSDDTEPDDDSGCKYNFTKS